MSAFEDPSGSRLMGSLSKRMQEVLDTVRDMAVEQQDFLAAELAERLRLLRQPPTVHIKDTIGQKLRNSIPHSQRQIQRAPVLPIALEYPRGATSTTIWHSTPSRKPNLWVQERVFPPSLWITS